MGETTATLEAAVGRPQTQSGTDFHEAYFHREGLSWLQHLYGRVFGFPLATNWLRFHQILRCLPARMENVLDIGCGNGYMLFYLAARNPAFRALAIDVDGDAIARNRVIAKRLGLANVTLEAGTWQELTAGLEGTFDTVLLLDVITEAEDRPALLGRVRKLLSPGGRLVLGSALPSPARRWVDVVDPYWRQPHRLAQIQSLDLFGLLRETGFEVEEAKYIAGFPFGVPAHCADMLFYKSRGLLQALHAAVFPILKATVALELVVPPVLPTGVALRAR